MTDSGAHLLVLTAGVTGVLHALIPDHWLPFVLMGQAQRWPLSRVFRVSGIAAGLHGGLSVVLGLGALALGLGTAQVIGHTLEGVGSILLVLFGVVYACWSWRKGGHFHPGGSRLHADEVAEACPGLEGDAHPEHLHYHADEQLIAGRPARGSSWLALIVGLNPCVLFLPIVLAASAHGLAVMLFVILAYSVPTALLMVGLSVIGVSLGWRVRLPVGARYMEPASGLTIAAVGLVYGLLHG